MIKKQTDKNLLFNQKTKISEIVLKMQDIAVCVDDSDKVVGVFTEGDFRKSVLKGINTNNYIMKLMNKRFSFVSPRHTRSEVSKIFKKKDIQKILIIKNKKFVGIIDRDKFIENKLKQKTILTNPVIIMAGGLGKRLKPYTKILPKGLMPVGREPIIKMIMDEFYKNNFNNFNIILNYYGKMFEGYFFKHKLDYAINFFNEKKKLGTIGYLSNFKKKFNKTIFLTNCDILLKANYKEILKYHEKSKNFLTICASFKKFQVPYGICNVNKKSSLTEMIEKPEMNFLVNTGFYLIKPEALKYIPDNKKLDMNQFINKIMKLKKKIGVHPVPGNSWLDIGQWDEYEKTSNILKNNIF